MAPNNINTHTSSSNTRRDQTANTNATGIRPATPTISEVSFNQFSFEEYFSEERRRRNYPRSGSNATSITITAHSAREIIHEDDQLTYKNRERLLKAIVVTVGLSASALLASNLSSTSISWIGYSVAAVTAYTSQVLLASSPVNSISYYFTRVASAFGFKGNSGDSVDGKNATSENVKEGGIIRRGIRRMSQGLALRRGSRIEDLADCEMIPIEDLTRETPSQWQKIFLANRAVVVSILLSMYSIGMLSYLVAISASALNEGRPLHLHTTSTPSSSFATTTDHPSSSTLLRPVNTIDIRVFGEGGGAFTTSQPLIAEDDIYGVIIQRLGSEGTLLLCHSINLMYNCQRLLRARRRGLRIEALSTASLGLGHMSSFHTVCEEVGEDELERMDDQSSVMTLEQPEEPRLNNTVLLSMANGMSALAQTVEDLSYRVAAITNGTMLPCNGIEEEEEEHFQVALDDLPPPLTTPFQVSLPKTDAEEKKNNMEMEDEEDQYSDCSESHVEFFV